MDEPVVPPAEDELATLPYLGATRRAMLRERGIADRAALRAMPEEELAQIGFMGRANARRLHQILDGVTPEPVVRQRRSPAGGSAAAEPAAEPARRRRTRRTPVEETDADAAGAPSPAAAETPSPAPRRRRRAITAPPEEAVAAPGRSDGRATGPGEALAGRMNGDTLATAKPAAAADRTAGDGTAEESVDYDLAIAARREQLPAAVAQLTEAIRNASVAPALARQTTRLLEAADRLAGRQAELSNKRKRRAAILLSGAYTALRDAASGRQFSCKQQSDLADRLRRRRRRLERLLDKSVAAPGGGNDRDGAAS
jgi:hypothetical protein